MQMKHYENLIDLGCFSPKKLKVLYKLSFICYTLAGKHIMHEMKAEDQYEQAETGWTPEHVRPCRTD